MARYINLLISIGILFQVAASFAGTKPFPPAGIDQFTSIFNADIEILAGPLAGQTFKLINVTDTAQTVVRSDPFFDGGPEVDDISTFPVMPFGSTVPSQMRDSDIPVLPNGFNGTYAETVHLHMTSLNAVSADGQFRIVAGQPLKDEFPDVDFFPSYGIAVSVDKSGFPARSVFVPYALVVTPFGNFVSNAPGFERALWADVPINSFPQEGGNFTDDGPALLVPVDNLGGPPVAQLTNLVHTVKISPNFIELVSFEVELFGSSVFIKWKIGAEIDNTGFHIWRGIEDGKGSYKPTILREFSHPEQVNPEPNENCLTKIQGQLKINSSSQPPKLTSAIGNSAESTCYSFIDTSNLSDGIYYYLLEDISDNGKSTFHCDQIDAVTIGQGPAIDLESAINYCKEVTDSSN
jgi:hypothetical protein